MVNPLLVKAAPYVGIVAVLGMMRCRDIQHQRAIGAANERIHIADSTLRVVRRDSVRLDTIYRTDTLRFARTLVRRDTVLRTVDRFLRDTVPVPVEVVRSIVTADSQAIAACSIALHTCEERIGNAERRAALLERQNRDLQFLVPSAFRTNVKLGVAVGVGFALCRFLLCPKPD